MTKVTVIQADREAAIQFLQECSWPQKHAELALAFARHRASSDVVEALEHFVTQTKSWLATRDKTFRPGWMQPAIDRARKALSGQAQPSSDRLREALDERDLFSNPDMLDQAANEIDCGDFCDCIYREDDVNFSMCVKSDRGEYCPNDVAETLRAVAKVARKALSAEGEAG